MGEGNAQQLADQRKMHIVSLNFLNPEFFLEDFVAKEYSFLRQYCSNISIFCDAHDGALWWSELFSGKQALGRSVFGLYARPNEGQSGEQQQQQQQQQQDLRKPPLYASSTACFQGYEPQHMQADTRDWLDVDVIDMTWLGNNVHALRHSYWSLNREVIEDLRDGAAPP
ncbi:Chromosome III, complete sequence, related [Eimeria tenella]|uniref:Chromosome III, complete sequence, related n=1 Tax=Eimeria tenella TaxID=5802 RepID=U6L0V0_EIMTE|nr:Chromosome III, complete sequence, related [Eimeria tenella]CDJ43821.1 Chromosome III, complete sequence, related [Eimeria tenella]|eukprot:XP_013234570.1 Chromosome III, complete sequence, related [Eimeria tenella]